MAHDYSPHDVLLLDVDGVLAEFKDYLLRLIDSDHSSDEVVSPEIFDHIRDWHGPAMRAKAFAVCDEPSFWLNQPVVPGAQAAVELFREARLKIKCVTKPWEGCDRWDACRRRWLDMHFGISAKDVVSADDKRLQLGAAFVDDMPEHITAWSNIHTDKHAFLFDAPYNRPSSTPPFEWRRRIGWGSDLSGARAVLEALGRI